MWLKNCSIVLKAINTNFRLNNFENDILVFQVQIRKFVTTVVKKLGSIWFLKRLRLVKIPFAVSICLNLITTIICGLRFLKFTQNLFIAFFFFMVPRLCLSFLFDFLVTNIILALTRVPTNFNKLFVFSEYSIS